MKKLLILFLLAPFVLSAQNEAYQKLQNSLSAFTPNRFITVFRGMDNEFARMNFESYLQSVKGLASKDFTTSEGKITHTFIPNATKNNELLTVVYYITAKPEVQGAFGDYEVSIIDSVEMVGPAKLMVELFTEYWPGKTNIGDLSEEGAFAYKELLGDYITIWKVDDHTVKIKVAKGNTDVDYSKTWGINLPKE